MIQKLGAIIFTNGILDGFMKTEATQCIHYTKFVGDGDSSVYPTLLSEVPIWGHDIKKIECANHSCICYRSSLEKLASDNSNYRGKGGLIQKMSTCAARCAIKMCSQGGDRAQHLIELERDLINGPLRCFGQNVVLNFVEQHKTSNNHRQILSWWKEMTMREMIKDWKTSQSQYTASPYLKKKAYFFIIRFQPHPNLVTSPYKV